MGTIQLSSLIAFREVLANLQAKSEWGITHLDLLLVNYAFNSTPLQFHRCTKYSDRVSIIVPFFISNYVEMSWKWLAKDGILGGLHTVGFGGLIAIFGSSVIIPWYNNLKPKELEFVNFISVTAKASWRSLLDGIKSRLIPNLLSIFFHRRKFIVASEIQLLK